MDSCQFISTVKFVWKRCVCVWYFDGFGDKVTWWQWMFDSEFDQAPTCKHKLAQNWESKVASHSETRLCGHDQVFKALKQKYGTAGEIWKIYSTTFQSTARYTAWNMLVKNNDRGSKEFSGSLVFAFRFFVVGTFIQSRLVVAKSLVIVWKTWFNRIPDTIPWCNNMFNNIVSN
jgi:hypothetical protein